MSNLDSIPGQRGYLVMTSDGAIQQSSGDLQNDEETAAIILQMVQGCGKLMNSLNSDRRGSFHRLSVIYQQHTLVASVWNQKIHIVKRVNKETCGISQDFIHEAGDCAAYTITLQKTVDKD